MTIEEMFFYSIVIIGYSALGGFSAIIAHYFADLKIQKVKEKHIAGFIIIVWPLFWILTFYGIGKTGYDYAINN